MTRTHQTPLQGVFFAVALLRNMLDLNSVPHHKLWRKQQKTTKPTKFEGRCRACSDAAPLLSLL